jgi:hypothetical protein
MRLLIIFFLCFSNLAFSCSCIGKSKRNAELKKSDVVFFGKILSKKIFTIKDEYVPEEFYLKKAEYTILAIKNYKGKIERDTLKIITGIGHGDCGFDFSIGKSYIIYAMCSEKYFESGEIVNKFLSTDICMRNMLYNKEEEEKIERYIKRHPDVRSVRQNEKSLKIR